ncbi:transcriptional repressor NrdR [Candidatus Saccharibacteria bacterium]|nr:transcriptional repressor NrdR [Candidatus Saccharibacteria bacterium]MBH2007694.1 transcriptional repressor NrdR [Candidatus Saccharibacteria bacterium]
MNTQQYRIGDSKVLESREVSDGKTIRRRRETLDGKYRFTTYERIEKPNLAVIKRNASRELFDREKLAGAIKQSVGKFFKSEVEVERIIDDIEDAVYAIGESEVPSKVIGEIVLDKLADKNEVAYVRFSSVYHDFKTLDEFETILASRRKQQRESQEAA